VSTCLFVSFNLICGFVIISGSRAKSPHLQCVAFFGARRHMSDTSFVIVKVMQELHLFWGTVVGLRFKVKVPKSY